MSTQNILYRENVLTKYDAVLRKKGNDYLIFSRFHLGTFDLRDIIILNRMAELICANDCVRVPLRREAQELITKQLNKL